MFPTADFAQGTVTYEVEACGDELESLGRLLMDEVVAHLRSMPLEGWAFEEIRFMGVGKTGLVARNATPAIVSGEDRKPTLVPPTGVLTYEIDMMLSRGPDLRNSTDIEDRGGWLSMSFQVICPKLGSEIWGQVRYMGARLSGMEALDRTKIGREIPPESTAESSNGSDI